MRTRARFAALGIAAALALTGCGLSPSTGTVPPVAAGSIQQIPGLPEDAAVTVTSKSFTEQILLGKITVIALQAAGFTVTDLTNVPGSQPARDLIVSGDADVAWEYTGTAWLTYLGKEGHIPDPREQWQAVKDEDWKVNHVFWGEPAPLNNTYALAMNSQVAQELGITRLSQMKELSPQQLSLCVDPEFNSRSDGLSPLLDAVGLERGTDVLESNIGIYDVGAIYSATADGACNFGEVFTTDGRIKALDLTVLEDDVGFFPSYNASPHANGDFHTQHPQAVEVMEQIAPLLTNEVLMDLNYQVDVEGLEPVDVALDWMVEEGLITKP